LHQKNESEIRFKYWRFRQDSILQKKMFLYCITV
jgi:hypothetical protein